MGTDNEQSFQPAERRQLFQFCLYGFLKNQKYFDPFLIIAFMSKGFSFAAIGILIGFRAICVNVLEIPSGAIADVWGRRRCMIASMAGYISAFMVFAFAEEYWAFFPAMICFSIGEAFRTGTHKAMIFDWLTRNNKADQKTRVYGLTRSWSKLGSSLNSIIAAVIVIVSGNFRWVFLGAAVPYFLNIVNFMLYPKYLDGEHGESRLVTQIFNTLLDGLKLALFKKGLRNLILENICFEGFFSTAKDYIQPLLMAMALSLPFFVYLEDETRTALLIGLVTSIISLAESLASRHSHRLQSAARGEVRLTRILWQISLALYAVMGISLALGAGTPAIFGFLILHMALNVWKPVLVSRFHSQSELESGATTLSIANQGKSLSIAVIAPLLGWMVDAAAGASPVSGQALPVTALWPVAAVGGVAALIGLMLNLRAGAGD